MQNRVQIAIRVPRTAGRDMLESIGEAAQGLFGFDYRVRARTNRHNVPTFSLTLQGSASKEVAAWMRAAMKHYGRTASQMPEAFVGKSMTFEPVQAGEIDTVELRQLACG